MENLNLFDREALNEAVAARLLALIEEALHKEYGFKEFCYDIKREEKQVRDALAGNHKYFSVTWLPYILTKAPRASQKIMDYLCDLACLQHPKPKRTATPAEELRFYKAKIKDHGLEALFEDIEL
ncbi:MAG: hypothetical protein ACE5DW_06840 [Thermodesulfobacteriota bacterium]